VNQKELDSLLLQYRWYTSKDTDPIVLFCHAECNRNCEDLPLPAKMDLADLTEFKRQVTLSFSQDPFFSSWNHLSCKESDNNFLTLLNELFLLPSSFLQNIYRKKLYFSPLDNTLLFLLHENHFSFFNLEIKDNLEAAFLQLLAVERFLEKKFPYAYHPRYGYFSSRYSELGTALKFRIVMHLPFLMRKVNYNTLCHKFLGSGIKLVPFYWNQVCYPGLYVVENAHTLGMKESEIITLMEEAVSSLKVQEKRARLQAFESDFLSHYDPLLRSLAVLRSSCLLSFKEMITHLLNIRTGIEQELFPSLRISDINTCLCLGKPGHLELLTSDKKEDINFLRSQVISQYLEEAIGKGPEETEE